MDQSSSKGSLEMFYMNYDILINGLRDRGFDNIDGICNEGTCNKDDKHFILYTDGLIIYSNSWDHNISDVTDSWVLDVGDELFPGEVEFNFKDLDEMMEDSNIEYSTDMDRLNKVLQDLLNMEKVGLRFKIKMLKRYLTRIGAI